MTNFQSFHLIVNIKPVGNRRHAYDFIDADFFVGEVFLLYFRHGIHPQM